MTNIHVMAAILEFNKNDPDFVAYNLCLFFIGNHLILSLL